MELRASSEPNPSLKRRDSGGGGRQGVVASQLVCDIGVGSVRTGKPTTVKPTNRTVVGDGPDATRLISVSLYVSSACSAVRSEVLEETVDAKFAGIYARLTGKTKEVGVFSTTRISSKGQIVIPKRLREELGLKPGDPLAVVLDGGALVLCKITLSDLVDASLHRYRKRDTLSHAEAFADLL